MEKINDFDDSSEFKTVATAFVLYILELEGAIETFHKKENLVGIMYVVRGHYEMLLQFGYLMESFKDKEECEKRARCYNYFLLWTEQKFYNISRLDAQMKNDQDTMKKYENILKGIEEAISNQYSDIYKDHKDKKFKIRNWFTLYSDIRSFNELEETQGYLDTHSPYNEEGDKFSWYDYLSNKCHGRTAIINFPDDKNIKLAIASYVGVSSHLKDIFLKNVSKNL
jgi:hypothetical protein